MKIMNRESFKVVGLVPHDLPPIDREWIQKLLEISAPYIAWEVENENKSTYTV